MKSNYRPIRLSCDLIKLTLLLLASIAPTGCSNDSEEEAPRSPLIIVASSEAFESLTGAAAITPNVLFTTRGGAILLNDTTSDTIVVIVGVGNLAVYTSKGQLTAATGETDVALGPFDQVLSGTRAGEILTADAVSGLLLRLAADGTPTVHAGEGDITQVTGAASAKMSLPRHLTINQIVSQDLVSGHILMFDSSGNPTIFVSVDELATAAGVTANEAIVGQWTAGGSTELVQYARIQGFAKIVRMKRTSELELIANTAEFTALFPGIADLSILDIAASPRNDALLVLIGSGTQGIALAAVADGGGVSVFSSAAQLAESFGPEYRLAGAGIRLDGTPYSIDSGNHHLGFFGPTGGAPVIVIDQTQIESLTGVTPPRLGLVIDLLDLTIAFFEGTSGTLLRAQ